MTLGAIHQFRHAQRQVTPSFALPDDTKFDIEITTGSWWDRWNQDINETNVLLTNTLLNGGDNNISYNNLEATWTWYGADVAINQFVVKKFLP